MNPKPCIDHKLPMTKTATRRVGCTRWVCPSGCVWYHTDNDVWFQTSHKKRGDVKRGCQVRVSDNGRAVLAKHSHTPQSALDEKIEELKRKG